MRKRLAAWGATSALVVAGGLGSGASVATAALPQPLGAQGSAGEQLASDTAATVVSGPCPVPGQTVTWTFSTSGQAVGPYPGTFTASGTFTVTAGRGTGLFAVSEFRESFVISSAAGSVSGTKTGDRQMLYADFCPPDGHRVVTILDTTYEATIAPSGGGRYRDSGQSTGLLQVGPPEPDRPTFFSENFTTSTGVVPVTPSSKDDCKNGGWKNFADDQGRPFKNQGQCVTWAAQRSPGA